MKRIIQIAIGGVQDGDKLYVAALTEDGDVYIKNPIRNFKEDWKKMPGIPDDPPRSRSQTTAADTIDDVPF